ncbi:hypothetical protein MELB17_09378 [Marinobacter sp. ELB17]|nr:hypothetical protein MELB17_09378 [Marinobacter sp. ELB17]
MFSMYIELAHSRRHWTARPLSHTCRLRFESDELGRMMEIPTNYYATLCLNFELANRYGWENGLREVFGNLDASGATFQCQRMNDAEEHFGYLESAFGDTMPDVPENPATDSVLANHWAKRLTTEIALTYQTLFISSEASDIWQAPNYALRKSLAKTGRLCAAHLIADLDQRTSIFVELQRPLSVSCG